MAGENRTSTRLIELLEELEREPFRYDFFQALRRLECATTDQPRIGASDNLHDDPIRLGQEATLAFAPSTLAALERESEGTPRLLVYFFGLLGANGPLPLHLTEYVRDRIRNEDDTTLARFLDVFHHRLLSLFYRAWAVAQPTVQLDRPESDRFADYVGTLIGVGIPELQDRDAFPDWAKLYYAGHLASPTHHAKGLAAMVQDFFQVPVTVEEFVAHWIRLPEDCHLNLGTSPRNSTLGETAVLGDHVWDCTQTFRLRLGPMPLEQYRRFLPPGDSLPRLLALIRNDLGDELDCEVQLVLETDEIPSVQLGNSGQLGWTSWMIDDQRTLDADDLILKSGVR